MTARNTTTVTGTAAGTAYGRAKRKFNDRGWSIEYKLPYHVLRFSLKKEYTWGMNVIRYISRKKEEDLWILVRKKESGWISRYGHIVGISGIRPPSHLEFIPFTLGRSTFLPKSAAFPNGREWVASAGLDMRYGLTSNVSLNATINPDFGQVEADPAVLNLSVFETYFQERRPFFIEGNTIFQTPQPDIVGIDGHAQLFYSRRIGKQPGLISIPGGSSLIDSPDATTVLGAAKLSGKTEGKTAFGIVDAVTADEYATVEQPFDGPADGSGRNERKKFLIEPLTNYFIGRVQQDIATNSSIGTMITAVNRKNFTPVCLMEVDANLKWGKNAYSFYTRFAGSRTGSNNNRMSGYEALAYFSKFSGWFGGQLYANARSPKFNANDLGYMNRAGYVQSGAHTYVRINNPWVLARQSQFNFNAWSHWNHDGVNLLKGMNFNTWHNLKNYWSFNFGISRYFEAFDDMGTRGGPLMIKPAGTNYWVNASTDSRKWITFSIGGSGYSSDLGSSLYKSVYLNAGIRPASFIQLETGPSYNHNFDFSQWIRNIDEPGGINKHVVFGELKSRILSWTSRANIAFTTNLTLQCYVQSFMAVGDFGRIKELARPSSYDFLPYGGLDFNPDFSRRSLRGNVVLRWEYRPGSVIFLVWSQSRSASFDIEDPSFLPWEGVSKSFTDSGENIFLIKINYWLGI